MPPSLGFHKFLTTARKLLPFLPPVPLSPRMAKEQDASLLYTRLPPELRRTIWETYFRGHAVHIYRSRQRLRARECVRSNADDVFAQGAHFDVCGRADIPCDHISLLLTCKKMYSPNLTRGFNLFNWPNLPIRYFECIYILYHKTLFDFSHAQRCLAAMSERLPATHVAHIAQISFHWELYHPLLLKAENTGKYEILWVDIWDALAAMEGLRWLRVELSLARPHQAPEWTEIESTLWEGIKKVTRPSRFELILPFPAAASTREETLPCTIIRRVSDDR